MELDVSRDEQRQEFAAKVNGERAVLSYETRPGRTLDYLSTVVPESHRGRGIGTALVRHALEYARKHGYRVIPTCPFVRRVMDRNAEYSELKVGAARTRRVTREREE